MRTAACSVVLGFLAPSALLVPSVWAQGAQFRNLALSGQQAPGLPPGITFSAFNSFSINASGRVAMYATVSGLGVTAANRDGIWWDVPSPTPGALQLVMRQGNPAPGQPTFNYTSTTAANLSDSGVLSYVALIGPTGGGSRDSQWTISPTTPASAFAVGFAQVPGLEPGAQWSGFSLPQINANGDVAFRAILGGTASGTTHWLGQPASLALVSRDNAPTGLLPGVNFSGVFNEYRFNSAGQFVFRSSLTGTGVDATNNQALWSRSPAGTLSLVARTGSQVPGLAPGAVFTSFIGDPDLDRSGRFAFRAVFAGAGVTTNDDVGVVIVENGVGSLLVRENDQAPGLPAGVVFDGSFEVTFGGQDTIALRARLRGPGVTSSSNTGLWKRTGTGPFTLVARAGSPAPGATPPANFGTIGSDSNVAMNAAGRILLVTPLSNSRDGIWIEDASGQLKLVVLEFTPFDANDDPNITVLKTISAISFPPEASDDDGRFSAFSDRGEVVFRATFTDTTSGAFVGSLPPTCDTVDFNNDGVFPDDNDLADFIFVLGGGTCTACNDVDFNNDGVFPDDSDLATFLFVLGGGSC